MAALFVLAALILSLAVSFWQVGCEAAMGLAFDGNKTSDADD